MHIANPALPERQVPTHAGREVQLGIETNIMSSRRPGDGAVQRPNTVFPMVFPMVPQFYPDHAKEQSDAKVKRERSRSPRANAKTKPAGDPCEFQEPTQSSNHTRGDQLTRHNQDVPKQLIQKCSQRSPANLASIWSLPKLLAPFACKLVPTGLASPRKDCPTSPRVQ